MPLLSPPPITVQPSTDRTFRVLLYGNRRVSRPVTTDECSCWSDPAHCRAGTYCPSCLERKAREESSPFAVEPESRPFLDVPACPACGDTICDEPIVEFLSWDSIDVRTLGIAARKEWDVCAGAGAYCAGQGRHSVPPMHFDVFQRAAFRRGFACEMERQENMDFAMEMEHAGECPVD